MRMGPVIVLLTAAMELPGSGQAAGGAVSGSQPLPVPANLSASAVVRVIDDARNGVRWLLMRDADHPGGPGRMVQVAVLEGVPSRGKDGANPSPLPSKKDGLITMPTELFLIPLGPIVRAGDRLIVEEHTAIVDARLEAVALTPAAAGATLNVRLKIGGKVVRAMVLGAGRAALQLEARP